MLIKVEDRIVQHIIAHCPARTDEALQERFGISYNTLRKIETGQSVRRTLAQRLSERLQNELLG